MILSLHGRDTTGKRLSVSSLSLGLNRALKHLRFKRLYAKLEISKCARLERGYCSKSAALDGDGRCGYSTVNLL